MMDEEIRQTINEVREMKQMCGNSNNPDPAPCCLDCPDYSECPDRCHETTTIYCVGVIDDCKGIPQTNHED